MGTRCSQVYSDLERDFALQKNKTKTTNVEYDWRACCVCDYPCSCWQLHLCERELDVVGMYCGNIDGQFIRHWESCHTFAMSHLQISMKRLSHTKCEQKIPDLRYTRPILTFLCSLYCEKDARKERLRAFAFTSALSLPCLHTFWRVNQGLTLIHCAHIDTHCAHTHFTQNSCSYIAPFFSFIVNALRRTLHL